MLRYNKAVAQTISELQRSKRVDFKFLEKFEFASDQVHRIMMKVNPSPTGRKQLKIPLTGIRIRRHAVVV